MRFAVNKNKTKEEQIKKIPTFAAFRPEQRHKILSL